VEASGVPEVVVGHSSWGPCLFIFSRLESLVSIPINLELSYSEHDCLGECLLSE
jgi:hypothetical protein